MAGILKIKGGGRARPGGVNLFHHRLAAHPHGVGRGNAGTPGAGKAHGDAQVGEGFGGPPLGQPHQAAGMVDVPGGHETAGGACAGHGFVQQGRGGAQVALGQAQAPEVAVGSPQRSRPVEFADAPGFQHGLLGRSQFAALEALFAQAVPAEGVSIQVPGRVCAVDASGKQRGGLFHAALPRPQRSQVNQHLGQVPRAVPTAEPRRATLGVLGGCVQLPHLLIDGGDVGLGCSRRAGISGRVGHAARGGKSLQSLAVLVQREPAASQISQKTCGEGGLEGALCRLVTLLEQNRGFPIAPGAKTFGRLAEANIEQALFR